MEQESEKKFPLDGKDYKLFEEVGEGVSATVYRALCVPLNEVVAIKVLDLEKCNNDLDGIRREVQTMILIGHPNLLRAHCSFTTGHNLWVVMPFIAGGSCLHIMKSAYPDGFEETVIATLLCEVLKALVYLHSHGHIHRDVKAGNILIDTNGSVKLADFGVAACMYDTGDRQRSRNTFVGTPCWMAPEVMQQTHGYDFKADIWSFGITALELAHGHAPFSKYPPMKVLLMTLQNAPPGLDYERDKRFSKSFKAMVAACLVKDPKKRPTSEKLLKHPFFKQARSNEYLARSIVEGLNPLGERFRTLKANEAELLVRDKALYEDKEHLSQQEYIRGISAWNFNLEDLKNQAALIQDDLTLNSETSSLSGKHMDGQESLCSERGNCSKDTSQFEDELNDFEQPFAAFPVKPLQALKGCFDVIEDDTAASSPCSRDSVRSNSEQQNQQQTSATALDREVGREDARDSSQSGPLPHSSLAGRRKFSSSSLLQDNILSPRKFPGDGEREHLSPRCMPDRNYSGPLQYRQKKDSGNSYSGEDASEGAVIERRGRFKVTSADMSAKGPSNLLSPISTGPVSPTTPSLVAGSVLPSLHALLQQNTAQNEQILQIIKSLEQFYGTGNELPDLGTSDLLQTNPTARERELQAQVIQMQQSIAILVEELQKMKTKNSQLEKQLNAGLKQDDKTRE